MEINTVKISSLNGPDAIVRLERILAHLAVHPKDLEVCRDEMVQLYARLDDVGVVADADADRASRLMDQCSRLWDEALAQRKAAPASAVAPPFCKEIDLPVEAIGFLSARPDLPAHPTDRLQKAGPGIAMCAARDYLKRNNLDADQVRVALEPHLQAVWADAIAPANAALEGNPTWCSIRTRPDWDWHAIYSSPAWQEASRAFLAGMAQAGENAAREAVVAITRTSQRTESNATKTEWELRTVQRLKHAREVGDEVNVAQLEALLAEQGRFRKEAESLLLTLNDIQKTVLLRAWKVSERQEEARFAGFFWGAVVVGFLWVFLASGRRELTQFFSDTIGSSLITAEILALLTGGASLLLLFQYGAWGKTIIHVFVAWWRQRQEQK